MTNAEPASPGIAVIGCGAWGRNHVRSAAELGVLRAVYDADTATAQAAALSAGVGARDLDDILGDADISGIVVATPDRSHAELGMKALGTGKSVLLEKPMATSVGDGVALVDLARDKGLVLMTGHILLYHPGFLGLCGLVRDRALGPLRHISCKRLHLARGAKRHALWDLAPHDLSMILELTGAMPTEIRAQAGAPIPGAPPQLVSLSLTFADGPSADISVSAIHPVKLHQITVAGADAFAVFDDTLGWDEKLSLIRPGLESGDQAAPTKAEYLPLEPDEPLKAEIRSFLKAMAGGPTPPSHGGEGLAVVQILAAAERSMESGKSVILDRMHPVTLET
jgi:predicted dehydrogenase